MAFAFATPFGVGNSFSCLDISNPCGPVNCADFDDDSKDGTARGYAVLESIANLSKVYMLRPPYRDGLMLKELQWLNIWWQSSKDGIADFAVQQAKLQQTYYPDADNSNYPLKQVLNGITGAAAIGFGMLAAVPGAAVPSAFLAGLVGLIDSIIGTALKNTDDSLKHLSEMEESVSSLQCSDFDER
jgi:hypothetical protein